MIDKGVEGAEVDSYFDRNRFIGIAGREAFHVFDLKKFDFVSAHEPSGYVYLLQ